MTAFSKGYFALPNAQFQNGDHKMSSRIRRWDGVVEVFGLVEQRQCMCEAIKKMGASIRMIEKACAEKANKHETPLIEVVFCY